MWRKVKKEEEKLENGAVWFCVLFVIASIPVYQYIQVHIHTVYTLLYSILYALRPNLTQPNPNTVAFYTFFHLFLTIIVN